MDNNFTSLKPLGFNHYSVSKNGLVRNDRTNFILKPYLGDRGYCKVSLSENSNTKKVKIHRLVALMFCKNDYGDLGIVNHINGIKTDNRAENLEWITQTENLNHAFDTGLTSKKIKPVRCIETKVEYKSSYEASKLTNIGQGSITNVCSGIRKSAGGFTWEYIN
jgi:hypothetical protein